jgi:hypothetical protein
MRSPRLAAQSSAGSAVIGASSFTRPHPYVMRTTHSYETPGPLQETRVDKRETDDSSWSGADHTALSHHEEFTS